MIDNAAREPEIVDICQMLVEMGAQIDGIGSSTLEIEGVESLHPVTHRTVPDRIVAGYLGRGRGDDTGGHHDRSGSEQASGDRPGQTRVVRRDGRDPPRRASG
jgi:hypothetical protein